VRLASAGYRYPDGAAVGPVDLEVTPGQCVLLTGPSGSGKSTVLRLAAGLAARHGAGVVQGRVLGRDGVELGQVPPAERARRVGRVTQDPADQLVAGTVDDELAFGPEGVGFAPEQTLARVDELRAELGLPGNTDPRALSSGQQQQLVVAATLAAGATTLWLDEPLSHLDPHAAAALMQRLATLAERGVAVVVAEHRVDACWSWADRVVVIRQGVIVHDRPRAQTGPDALAGLQLPAALVPPPPVRGPEAKETGGDVVVEVADLDADRGGRRVLHGVSLRVRRGERIAVVGPNGAGKSTLLEQLPGLGVPADPDLSLFCATVAEELAVGPRERGRSVDIEGLAGALGLASLLQRPPQALSRGQRLRVAVGAALATLRDDPDGVLLLDEPTTGQDQAHVEALFAALRQGGVTLVFATHDLELAARHAHRAVVLVEGRVVAEGPAQQTLAAAPLARSPRVAALIGEGPEVPVAGSDRPAASLRAAPRGGLDPRVRLGLVGLVGLLAITLDGAWSLGALAAVTGAVATATVGRRRWALLGVAAAVVWSTVLSQALFYADRPRVALLALGPVVLWREGVVHGLVQSLRMVAMAFAGVSLAVTTAPDRLLQGLVALRVPWAVALVAVTALRAVPQVVGEWQVVRRARRRGVPPSGPWARLRDELLLLRPVVARAVRRARHLAEALDARGFDPVAPRRPRRALRLGLGEGVALGLLATGVAAVVGAEVLYQLYLAELLYVPALRPLYAWVR